MNVKAELSHSAFTRYIIQENKNPSVQKKFELAKILYLEEKYVKALKVILPLTALKIDDPLLKIKINLFTGKILNKDKNKDAVKYFRRSLELIDQLNLEEKENYNKYNDLLAENYIDLSFYYNEHKDSSRYYLEKLINLESVNNKVLTLKADAHINLGRLFALDSSYQEAEKMFLKSIEINSALKNNLSMALAYNNLASLFVEGKKYEKGKKLYKKALTYLKNENSIRAMEHKEMLLDNISWALYKLKDYKAYEYVTESYAIRDSLQQGTLTRQIEEIKAKHNVGKVQRAADIKQDKLERKNWIIGIVGVVVSLLFFFLANLYKLRQRNLSLKLSQNELRQQRKLDRLKSQTQIKILNATIDGKETERKQIAETLHDNVSALLSSANMHLQASQKQFGGVVPLELQKTQQIIAEASQKIRDLSHNLISSVLLKFGLEYAVKDLAKKFSNSSIKINTAIHNVHRYSEECEIKVFNIIQELVNNILKHSKAENAYIIIEEEDGKLNIIVKDDGEGFVEKSNNETGIGLNHIKARINIMKGHFLLETAIGEGTKVIMNIPVVKKREMVIA